jgi:hypothetical protein
MVERKNNTSKKLTKEIIRVPTPSTNDVGYGTFFLAINILLTIIPTYIFEILLNYYIQDATLVFICLIIWGIFFAFLFTELKYTLDIFSNIFGKNGDIFKLVSIHLGTSFSVLILGLYFLIPDYSRMVLQGVKEIVYLWEGQPETSIFLTRASEASEKQLTTLTFSFLIRFGIFIFVMITKFKEKVGVILKYTRVLNITGLGLALTFLIYLVEPSSILKLFSARRAFDFSQIPALAHKIMDSSISAQITFYFLGFESLFFLMPNLKLALKEGAPVFFVLRSRLLPIYLGALLCLSCINLPPTIQMEKDFNIIILKLFFSKDLPIVGYIYGGLAITRLLEVFTLCNQVRVRNLERIFFYIFGKVYSLAASGLRLSFLLGVTKSNFMSIFEFGDSLYAVFNLVLLLSFRFTTMGHMSGFFRRIQYFIGLFFLMKSGQDTLQSGLFVLLICFGIRVLIDYKRDCEQKPTKLGFSILGLLFTIHLQMMLIPNLWLTSGIYLAYHIWQLKTPVPLENFKSIIDSAER